MPDKYKYYITSRIGTRQVNPLGKLQISYDNRPEDFRRGYAISITGKATFAGDDFNWLYILEHSSYRCGQVGFSISKYCNGAYMDDWQTATISFNKATWNLDLCTVEVQLDAIDKYTCYEAHKDEELNVLQSTWNRQTVSFAGGTIEYLSITSTNGVPDARNPDDTKWTLCNSKVTYRTPPAAAPNGRIEEVKYATYNQGGSYTPALVYNPVYTHTEPGPGITSDQTDYSIYTAAATIDNGMKLQDVFEAFLANFCTGITLKSNFFQWRPNVASSINYVTQQPSKVLNLILFQKTDVKRPYVSGNAVTAMLTFEQLLKNICTMFNCRWDIEDNGATFRIEHYSYTGWAGTAGLDLTQPAYSPYTAFKRKYSYKTDVMPKFEKFRFMESGGQDFIGADIWYDSPCVSNDESSKNKQYEADKISTDVALVMANPDPDSKLVSDEGFVLVACEAGSNVVITKAGILSPEHRVNNTLAWAQLHKDYYMQGRVVKNGYLNRQPITFTSLINTKLQDKISVPVCCNDMFNPDNLVQTSLGYGQVSKATYTLENDMLQLELLYNAEDGLFVNQPPIALGTTVTCIENSYVDVDISSLVSDPDGNLGLTDGSLIISSASNGTATIINYHTIRFTPDNNYADTGANFYYAVKDVFGERSLLDGKVTVNITPVATAVNDSYTAFTGEEITGNLISNDIGTGITATPSTASSIHGGTVTVNTDGSFTYTSASTYTGTDSFTYTITDSGGHTSTGTVTVTVRLRQMVYVRMEQTITRTEPIMIGSCSTPDPDSKLQYSNIIVKYYSDAAGTSPFNIDDYHLTIHFNRITTNNYPSPVAGAPYPIIFVTHTGTSENVFGNEVVTHRAFYNCATGAYDGTDFTDNYSLATGDHYTII